MSWESGSTGQAGIVAAVEQAADGVVITDTNGMIQYVNGAFTAITGYTSLEARGQHTRLLKSGRHPASLYKELWDTVRSGRVWHGELINRRKDGSLYTAEMRITPVRDSHGDIVGHIAVTQDVTERRAAQDAQRFLAAIVDSSEDAIAAYSAAGIVLTWSRGAESILGHSAEEAIGKHLSELVEHEPGLAHFTAQVLQGHVVSQFEGVCRRKDGRRLHVSVTGSPLSNDAGDIVAVAAVLRDISGRKRAEEALHESEDRFRIMADSCPTIMWVTDAEGGNRFVNRTYREFFGTTYEQIKADKWQPLLHPDDAASYLGAFRRAIEEQAPFRAEARTRRADGEWRWVGSYAEPRFSPTGEFLGHAGLTADITERLQAQEALRASEERYHMLAHALRSAGECVSITDAEDRILYVNEAFLRTYGYAEHELIGQHIGMLRSERTATETQDGILPATLAGQWCGEVWNRTKDGREFPISLATSVACDEHGRRLALVGIARDITESKRYEEELLHARAAADAANHAKSRLLANMSHEIRTPMNGVIGMLQLLLHTDLSPQQRNYAGVIESSGRALLALIDDILDLSKIEAGRVTLEHVDFDLSHTVEDVVQPLRVQANAKGLTFLSRLTPDTPSLLRGDPNRLRQALNNLASNAIKFTAQGQVAIDVSLASRADGRATVRFVVTDTGIGIRPDQTPALFSAFVQADASTTRKFGGTGLGLAISKQLVELMGGQIGLESRVGEGSTFWFTADFEVPSEADFAPPSGSAPTSEPPPPHERIDSRRVVPPVVTGAAPVARILVAEDNPINQIVALAQLRKLGYEANAVANGAEAVETLQHGTYDLVLMDCEMPIMDGYEATHRIRASSAPYIPIIAVSAHAMSSHRDRCLREGMDDFLSKPVDMQHLADALAKWLARSEGRGAAPTVQPASPEQPVAFDAEALLSRVLEDRSLAGEIIDGFIGDFPSQLANLRQRFTDSDRPGARMEAHTLKGSAATVSANGLRAVAQEMEEAADAGELDRFGGLLPRAVEEFDRFTSTLTDAGWL